VTTTFPHIPVHTPLVNVEWIVHRNLNVPACENRRCWTCPVARPWLKVQLFPYAEMVCVPLTAFH
jgi:hypothetical protein